MMIKKILKFLLFSFLFTCLWGLASNFSLPMSELRIASLNVNGARHCLKRAQLYEIIKQKRLDVVPLQETHSTADNASEWAVEWNGLPLLSHNTSVSGGVAVLFAKSFTPVSYDVVEVLKGRILKGPALKIMCWSLSMSMHQQKLLKDCLF